jgi:hypothetical protein
MAAAPAVMLGKPDRWVAADTTVNGVICAHMPADGVSIQPIHVW